MNYLIKTFKAVTTLWVILPLLQQAHADDANHVQARLSQLEKQLQKALQAPSINAINPLTQRFDITALLELETFIEDNQAQDNQSDTTLATIEVAIHSRINPYIEGQVLLLHEDGNEQDIALDEGYLSLSVPQSSVQLKAGKQVIAFGNFESHCISDPLTLELAETKNTAITLQSQTNDYYALLYVFNGDTAIQGNNDEIKQSGIQLGLLGNLKHQQWHLGAGYISSIGESTSFKDYFSEQANDYQLQDNTPAASVHGSFSVPHWHLLGEYITATQSFHQRDLAFAGSGAQPSVYHVEIAHDFAMLNRALTLSVAQQGSQQALALELPKRRYLMALSHEVYKHTSISLEYMYAQDYSLNQGGLGNTQHTLSMQLAASF